jgi:hypothetical protein
MAATTNLIKVATEPLLTGELSKERSPGSASLVGIMDFFQFLFNFKNALLLGYLVSPLSTFWDVYHICLVLLFFLLAHLVLNGQSYMRSVGTSSLHPSDLPSN